MTSTITVGGNSVTLVALPDYPAARAIEFEINDTVGAVDYEFTKQMQVQEWAGGDWLACTVTMPPLTLAQAGRWKAWMMQMRGIRNAVQMCDPKALTPQGTALGTPLVDGSVGTNNLPMAQVLYTKGWTPNQNGALLPYDALQIGYRFHYVLDRVNADSSGKAAIPIWPVLREQPADGTALVLNNPKALFRFASNKRKWSDELRNGTRVSLALTEFR